ncbi:MAG TPA: DPP IV N-terminal domain-containing protein, partial [Gemmatimonadaceae bacterium]
MLVFRPAGNYSRPGTSWIGACAVVAAMTLPLAAAAQRAVSRAGSRAGSRTGAAEIQSGGFTLAQALSYPFVTEMKASPRSSRIAWIVNREGVRNVWTADGPDYAARQLTHYASDDGQELTNVEISPDGKWVIYVRGGDHDANFSAEGGLPPDPAHSPDKPKVEIWALSADAPASASPKLLAEGDEPVISPRGDRVAFVKGTSIWVVPTAGGAPARQLFFARGSSTAPTWSPAGDKLAFVSNRGDHSFIGIFRSDSTPVQYLAPSTFHDNTPVWSPDGMQVAFIRVPGSGGAPETALDLHPRPWGIWTADVATGVGHRVWQSPNTLLGSVPTTDGRTNLAWASGDRLVFLSDVDGWPHLYSVIASGGTPLLLTPGAFMVEFITMSPDGASLVYAANTGTTAGDGDRRHIYRVPVDRSQPVAVTSGDGIQWTPQITGDGRTIAYVGADARRPPLPMIVSIDGGAPRALSPEIIPATFPSSQFVTPRPVQFKAADGTVVHGQLFEASSTQETKKPGIVFVHGGPPRQMMLGWHYMDYYSNSYAVNQYLANHGYVVLSVNYRLGIGYGHNYHHPAHAGATGASEYQDVKAGGEYLRTIPSVDSKRIG